MDSVNVTLDVNLFVMIAVIIVYLGAVAFLSWLGRIKSRGDDFASGGRNIPSAVMALSYGAAFISTSAIVGFGGMAAEIGMSLIWLAGANIFFGIFLAFAVFGKRTRAVGLTLDAHTFPEFLSKRFASPFIRYFTAAVMIVSMPLYAAAVLIGAARILESLLGVPYEYALAAFSLLVAVYVLIGGLRGVMYTDALQGTLMIAGMLFLLVAMFIKLGGPIDAFSKLHAMKELVPPESAAAGHQGWLSDPKVFSPVWWTLYSSLVFGVGVGVLAQPHLAVRCLTVKTSAELNRAAAVGGVFILITVATPYVLGALSNVFFYEKDGVLASVAAGHNVDSVIPLLIKQVIMNLLENAYFHAHSQKPVECFLRSSDESASVHIRDYGIGIPKEHTDDIFDAAPSSPSSASDTRKGMGIGLSICKAIINAHGGSIHAVSHPDGAEFYFTLPKEELHHESDGQNPRH